MTTRFLLLAATVALGTAASAAQGPAWGTLPEALALARAEGRPALVYVHAPWCGPCRRLERETFPAVASRLGAFARAELTIDDRDRTHRVGPYRLSEAEWAARLGAETTPTLVLLDADGAVLGRHTGFLPPDGLRAVLDAALAAAPEAADPSALPPDR
ncbi:MAG: thioredoxin family protein [Bacteroidota bacterium]